MCALLTLALLTDFGLAAPRFFFEAWPNVDMSVAGELRAVQIAANRIEYYDVGQGPVVLLIHGRGTDATDWQNVIAPLAKRYRLVIPDAMVYPFDARDLWQLLDHLGIQKLAVVGHSAGARVGQEMYFMRPSRVWAFANVDSTVVGGRSFGDELPNSRCSPRVQALHEKNDHRLTQLEPQRQAVFPDQQFAFGLSNEYPSDVNVARLSLFYNQRERMPWAGTRSLNRDYPEGRRRVMKQVPSGRPRPAAVKTSASLAPLPEKIDTTGYFKCPVLLFNAGYGKVDGADLPHKTERWKGGPLRADLYEFVLVRDSGHWIWLDQPQIFLDRTLGFLKRHALID